MLIKSRSKGLFKILWKLRISNILCLFFWNIVWSKKQKRIKFFLNIFKTQKQPEFVFLFFKELFLKNNFLYSKLIFFIDIKNIYFLKYYFNIFLNKKYFKKHLLKKYYFSEIILFSIFWVLVFNSYARLIFFYFNVFSCSCKWGTKREPEITTANKKRNRCLFFIF